MKISKIITSFVALFFGVAVGIYVAKYFNDDNRADFSEDIIGQEIQLLEAAKQYFLPCDQLPAAGSVIVSKEGNLVILWKKADVDNQFEKFVIDQDFNTALENVECTKL